jgi:subtilisin family serine protease
MRRTLFVVAGLASLAACDSGTEPLPSTPAGPAPLIAVQGAIPGRFIVTLRDEVDPLPLALEYGVRPTRVYEHVLSGFAGDLPSVLVEALRSDPRVLRVEQDGMVVATETATQAGATWGLDRIDQRGLPLDASYTYGHTGAGVTAYIIDSGIRHGHAEFGGRASFGFDAMADSAVQRGADCNGHGTHVAGTVGGSTYGVAKAVKLVSVRVLDCGGSGSFSGIIAGMDWVAANGTLPAVANISIGSLLPQRSATIDAAAASLVASGVTVSVAAGNGIPNGGVGIDACSGTPGGHPDVITVGASDRTDQRTVWSNWGECVNLFAPGSSITSATHLDDTGASVKSGTSMAAPHVAGVAALYLEQAPGAAPATVKTALLEATTKSVVQLSLSGANHLLYSRVLAPVQPPTETGPKPCTPRGKKKGICR